MFEEQSAQARANCRAQALHRAQEADHTSQVGFGHFLQGDPSLSSLMMMKRQRLGLQAGVWHEASVPW
jgi:hypothetical protein